MQSQAPQEHKPFVPASTVLPELTPVPLLVGVILGIVFGASSLYLALRVGMTVSASIPVAVLSITLFRAFSKIFRLRQATILENNITQTTGSAGESIAFGVAVTMPALLILGHDMEIGRTLTVSILGGLLGILMMIPLRYALIVKGAKELPFPEGTACAEVLIAGEKGGTSAKTVFFGFFAGFAYKFLNLGTKLWSDTAEKAIGFFKGAYVAAEVSPELLGVGYIIGPRIASITVAGGLLSTWLLTPAIKLFGDLATSPLFPATKKIADMNSHEIWKNYVLYIGAGAVAAGGIISLFRSLPTIIHGAKSGLGSLGKAGGNLVANASRTERDLPLPFVLIGCVVLIAAIWAVPSLHMNFLGALLVVAFGFLFVTVSSRLTGEIGSSSNPISGMTVATLLFTSLVFLALGWTSDEFRLAALSVAAVVCIASSNGGTTAQDLRTGYLVGGTPSKQQIAILIGALTSAVVIGFTLNQLNDASTVYSQKAVPPGVVVPNVAELTKKEKVRDSHFNDNNEYNVLWVKEQAKDGPLAALAPGKWLVDGAGSVKYLVDPGINGTLKVRDNGQTVSKYDAPKARLMSLIIDGILARKLPWDLVLLGAAIAIIIELCGVPSLPFAVGVYLPLAVSMPIFCGGVVRAAVNYFQKKRGEKKTAEEEESGPGVLFSSGLIAGGSICGIALAFFAVQEKWATAIDIGARFPKLLETAVTPTLVFLGLMALLFAVATKKEKPTSR